MKEIHNFDKTLYQITGRQLEIIKFLLLGYSHKKVAKFMNISFRTVDSQILNMTTKFHMPIFELLALYRCSQCTLFRECEERRNLLDNDALLLALNNTRYY
jgi:DNA-binding CsgD family transcriptional regulator